MADTQVTVRVTAEERQTWLQAAAMHEKLVEKIDWKRQQRQERQQRRRGMPTP